MIDARPRKNTWPRFPRPRFLFPLLLLGMIGCGRDVRRADVENAPPEPMVFDAQSYEASAEQLLAARLPLEETSDGWVRLFDGQTLFGWGIAGNANWRVEDSAIVVDQGQVCLLCTSMRWSDFELKLQYRIDASTNSGVFVRSPLEPADPATDCFEINLASSDNPFPTGSVVNRERVEPPEADAERWHDLSIRCDGATLSVAIDDQSMCQLDDADSPRSGYIGLQHNSGKAAFRDIRIRPLGQTPLLDAELSKWKRTPTMSGDFQVNESGELVVDGGKQQLESVETFGDFALSVQYQLAAPESNSGIFFRAIPGQEMNGYECQVNDGFQNDNRLSPVDCGTGGIFKRQDARIVAGDTGQWNALTLIAQGPKFAAWVNGVQVSDVYDDRAEDENPRRGLRTQPGSLMIQGHDPTTKAKFRDLKVVRLDEPID